MNTDKIIEITRPCSEGVAYLRRYKTLREAWDQCPRGDWMLWLAQKLGVDVRVLTLAKGLCANTVRHLMKDPRSVEAVDAAIAFGHGEMGEKELDVAADAAADAADAATYAAHAAHAAEDDEDDAACAAYAAIAADDAAIAADDAAVAAYAAGVAADVAEDAAVAATYAAIAATRKGVRAKTTDICREVLTEPVMQAALEAAERGDK